MSDLKIRQRDITNEQLQRLADSLAELVAAIKEQASTERAVDLSVERVAGPAVGEPIGYGFAFEPGGVHAPDGFTAADIPSQRLFLTHEAAEAYIADPLVFGGAARVIAVYDLPTEVEP